MRIKEEENSYVVEPDEAKHEGVVKIYRDNATIKLDYEKNCIGNNRCQGEGKSRLPS